MRPVRLFDRMISSVSQAGVLGVGSVVLMVGLGSFYSLMAIGVLLEESADNQITSCAMQDEAFLPAEAYGDFVQFLDGSHPLGSSRFEAGFSGEWRGTRILHCPRAGGAVPGGK
jgi:hypothetical protein